MKKNNHLQYKMFLLNLENFAELSAKKFYLQYKMFLLNQTISKTKIPL